MNQSNFSPSLKPSAARVNPPGFGSAVWIVMLMTIQSLLKRRKLVFMFLVLCLPPMISLVMKHEGVQGQEGFLFVFPQAYFLFLAPLVCLFHASSLFAEEVENRTIGYLLLRPVPRDTLLFGKFLGACFTSWVLLVFSAFAAYAAWAFDGDFMTPFQGPQLFTFFQVACLLMLSCALYTALSILIALNIRHSMITGIVYLMIVEALFSYAPGPPQKISMAYHVMRMLPGVFYTPEELISAETGFPFVEPNPLFIGVGLILALTTILTLCLFLLRSTDFSGGQDE